ncbi:hypothetical protein BU15DRAFT_87658 [Melanogaster broomeanus]|nr:hypothetical protein BU15DRAFT_87658 [Melanogaster broomeanus]
MQSSSPFFDGPSTPSRSSYYSARSHKPTSSSPLASPSMSSPTSAAHARRRSQYKSTAHHAHTSYRNPDAPSKLLFGSGSQTSEDPQKAFLRERFQARCRERAQRLREKTVMSRRSSDAFSDEFMDCDEEESEDTIMQDELFRRIMQSANHKKKHAYRVSYSLEVGSSFDPDMEDASVWETELRGKTFYTCKNRISSSAEPTPDELEEAELMEYAEHYTTLADFADLDLAVDDFSVFSDIEDVPSSPSQGTRKGNDMDMS